MPRLRAVVGTVHLWLGWITGAIVFVVAVTGACWVFHEEIEAFFGDPVTVTPQDRAFITPTEARRIAEVEIPGRHVHGALYGDATEPLEVIFWEEDPEFYRSVFLNPYDGTVLGVRDHLAGFFPFVLEGHLHLWLPEAIGEQVVAWSTAVFVVMLGTGLVLWWPRNRRRRAQKFRFVWKPTTGWKRKTYDLHSIAGMYVSVVALLAALTGLVMAFDAFAAGVYSVLGGDEPLEFAIPDSTTTPTEAGVATLGPAGAVTSKALGVAPIDRLPALLAERYPNARSFEVHYPATERSSIYVEIVHEDGVHYSSDYRFYDRFTLRELDAPSLYGAYANADIPDKVIRMTYDTHVGAILGLPTKILMFCASLVVASLPVTGFVFWWGKRKTSTSRSDRPQESAGRAAIAPGEKSVWLD